MNQPTLSDGQLVSRITDEAGSFLAFAVSDALREKDNAINDLRRENEVLRKAITGVRQFAPVETMTPDAREGYDLASKDLLLQASPLIDTNWDDLPPLGWGRSQELDGAKPERRALKLAPPPPDNVR
jgi:hypothetical protein